MQYSSLDISFVDFPLSNQSLLSLVSLFAVIRVGARPNFQTSSIINLNIGMSLRVRPLWQLAKKTLSYKQNLFEFHAFLKTNGRRHHHAHSINFQIMFLRVAVLMMFFQAQFITSHWWMLVYFSIKIIDLFRVEFQKRQALEVVGMLIAFHLLDYLTQFLPFMSLIYWYVNINYFLFGIEEKYLSLNIMLLQTNPLSKSIIITILALGHVKKIPPYTRAIAYLDALLILFSGRVNIAFAFLLLIVVVELVQVMDSRMIYTKKNYTHLDQLPHIQQYH